MHFHLAVLKKVDIAESYKLPTEFTMTSNPNGKCGNICYDSAI